MAWEVQDLKMVDSTSNAGSRELGLEPRFLERVEYGMFCESASGPILRGAEHRILGSTSGFPKSLVERCTPNRLGLSETVEERDRERLIEGQNTHGTVLRPIRIEGRMYPMLYRIGRRKEGGEGAIASRVYIVARYLLDLSGDVGPGQLYEAMSPFAGLTRDEAMSLALVETRHEAKPSDDSVDKTRDSFLPHALINVVSGIGIHVECDEKEFFQLVDSLWCSLPPCLRPLLSAGWNVGSSYSGMLAVTCSTRPAPKIPQFEFSQQCWTPSTLHTPVLNHQDLLPGRIFAFARYGSPIPDDDDFSSAHQDADDVLPELPSFADHATRAEFRRQGFLERDTLILDRLLSWLEDDDCALNNQLPALIGNVLRGPRRNDFLQLLESTIVTRRDKPRAWDLVWHCLLLEQGSISDETLPAGVVSWLNFLAHGSALESIRAFSLIVEEDVPPLPEHATSRWLKHLDDSLPQALDSHRELIEKGMTAALYGEWVSGHTMVLAFQLLASAHRELSRRNLLVRLQQGYDFPANVGTIIAWMLKGEAPIPDYVACLKSLPNESKIEFSRLLNTVYGEKAGCHSAQRRLLEWAPSLPPEGFSQPLLIIAADGQASPDQLISLGAPVLEALPIWLAPKLASAVMRALPKLRVVVEKEPARWEGVCSLFPVELAITLLDIPKRLAVAAPYTRLPTNCWDANREEIQERMEYWFSDRRRIPQPFEERACVLWKQAAQLHDPPQSEFLAVDLCRVLSQGELPESCEIVHDGEVDQVAIAIAIARAAGMVSGLEGLTEQWKRLTSATLMRILMELFPLQEFEPTSKQLASLVPHRRWLRSHLESEVIPLSKRAKFDIAQFGFHEIDYASFREKWLPSFREVGLWAAFQGLAESHYAALDEPLRIYAETDAERAQCCLVHLNHYDRSSALENVLDAFLLPLVRRAQLVKSGREPELILELARGAGNQQAGSWSLRNLGRSSEVIQISPAVFTDAKPGIARISPNRFDIAHWLFPLLWTVLRNPSIATVLQRRAKVNLA